MIPGTPSYLNIHLIFAVGVYSGLIDAAWENSMYDCITASLKKIRQRVLALNGTADHIHVLIGFKPNVTLDEIQQVIRTTGADFINENVLTESPFNWQETHVALSVGYKDLDDMYAYIMDQKNIHKKISFKKELIALIDDDSVDVAGDAIFV